MAFNGSGVHNRVHDWTQDLTNAIPVTASRMDAEHNDISSSLTNTICRDGQSTTTARIPFASGVSAAAGTTASVAYAQTNDANTGLYFPATDQWGLVAGGAPTLSSTATKVTATVAVDFTGAIAPTSSDGAALGSGTQMWSDLFLASGGVVNWNNGDVTISNFAANGLSFNGATGGYFFDAAVAPESDDGAPLGSTLLKWSDLHLAPGAVINFNDGDVTLTHSANALNIAGGTVTFDTAPTPSSSDAAALGTSSVMWSDLFLASGAVINFNNGDVTATHSADTLTVAGGKLVANDSAGITGRNTAKAFVTFTTDGSGNVTVVGAAFNVSGIAAQSVASQNGFRATFATAMSGANYTAIIRANRDADVTELTGVACRNGDKTTTTLDFVITTETTAATRANLTVDIVVFENA